MLQELGSGPLESIALSLGSDVPFFLLGGTAYATGRGEILTPLPPLTGIPLLLVLPEERVLTRDAFAQITRYSKPLGIDATAAPSPTSPTTSRSRSSRCSRAWPP